ncbi:MAG: SHOCT domain-containing protein [Actinobacteria bacterium]|nr:MAG: SHOCT domain-containing protein [Actinomycetota bacterium]
MFWWWGSGWGWVGGLISTAVLIAVIVVAVLLLRQELPHLERRFGEPPALRLLEERYARGEITREEFLERRRVLLETGGGSGTGADPTQPLPPAPPTTS